MSASVRIRPEEPSDRAAIHAVNVRAFGSEEEADLVDAIRGEVEPFISLVAQDGSGAIVGHILFTPVEVRGDESSGSAIALGPMAVLPECQRRGIGTALVEAGLEACRAGGESRVFVLGHPSYYPRFGFRSAAEEGYTFGSSPPIEAFFSLDLGTGPGSGGEVWYHPAFHSLD